MSRSLPISLLFASVLALSACGSGSEAARGARDGSGTPDQVTRDETWSYRFDVNGCDTKEQVLRDLARYCEALRDERRNSGCARDLRRKQFRVEGCPGDFDAGPGPNPAHTVPVPTLSPSGDPVVDHGAPPEAGPHPAPNASPGGSLALRCVADPKAMMNGDPHLWQGLEKGFRLEIRLMVDDPTFPLTQLCHLLLMRADGSSIASVDGECARDESSAAVIFVFSTLTRDGQALPGVDADLVLDTGAVKIIGSRFEVRDTVTKKVVFGARVACPPAPSAGAHGND